MKALIFEKAAFVVVAFVMAGDANVVLAFKSPIMGVAMNRLRLGHPHITESMLRSSSKSSEKENVLEQLGDVIEEFGDELPASETLKALERLRERQRSEIQETERLIEMLSASTGNYDSSKTTTADKTRSLSAAASFLNGFDYGFVSRSEGATSTLQGGIGPMQLFGGTYNGPPGNVLQIGFQQFFRNLNAIMGEYSDEEEVDLSPKQIRYREMLDDLTLNATEIWERELKDGPIQAPLIIKIPYLSVCYLLDVVFDGKYVPSRFFLLETVARMPYFSYISMLHLYETLGFWRRSSEVKRIHFAEELNEFRHLLIMESLGGDQQWWVRFLAQHSAIVYYVILCVLWLVSPSLSYRFSELLETHAVNTYGVFLDENEELLKKLPPSAAAVEYYCFGTSDPFYAEFQTSAMANGEETRRPGDNLRSLYDVFHAIREDEGDHVKTMISCLDPNANLRSPSVEKSILTGAGALLLASAILTGEVVGDISGLELLGFDSLAETLGEIKRGLGQ